MTQFVVLERNEQTVLPNGNTLGFDHWRATCITDDEVYARDWAECGRDARGKTRKKIILKTDDTAFANGLYGKFISDVEVGSMSKHGEIIFMEWK